MDLLERGREDPAGRVSQVPPPALAAAAADDGALEAGVGLQSPSDQTLGHGLGLFHFHQAGISVLVGCGLGGTSLINAGVSLRPQAAVFQDPGMAGRDAPTSDGQLPGRAAPGVRAG